MARSTAFRYGLAGALVALAAPASAAVDADAEVAAALYSASATQLAFRKADDAKLRADQARIAVKP